MAKVNGNAPDDCSRVAIAQAVSVLEWLQNKAFAQKDFKLSAEITQVKVALRIEYEDHKW